jgi:hypothetical protein
VMGELAFPAGVDFCDLERRHVWLLLPPPPALLNSGQPLDIGVWSVVCVAALHAMNVGRSQLFAASRRAAAVDATQTLITQYFGPAVDPAAPGPSGLHGLQLAVPARAPRPVPPPSPLMIAKAAAVREFWAALHGFAALGVTRSRDERWVKRVRLDHPFLAPTEDRKGWVVRGGPRVQPAGAATPDVHRMAAEGSA